MSSGKLITCRFKTGSTVESPSLRLTSFLAVGFLPPETIRPNHHVNHDSWSPVAPFLTMRPTDIFVIPVLFLVVDLCFAIPIERPQGGSVSEVLNVHEPRDLDSEAATKRTQEMLLSCLRGCRSSDRNSGAVRLPYLLIL